MKLFFAVDALVLLLATGALGQQQSSATTTTSASGSSSSNDSPIAQSSPAWLSDVKPLPSNIKKYPFDVSKILTKSLHGDVNNQALQGYPQPSKLPPTDSPEVQAVIKAIDWTKVPNIPPRKTRSDGYVSIQDYNNNTDPDCWWSASRCVKVQGYIHPSTTYSFVSVVSLLMMLHHSLNTLVFQRMYLIAQMWVIGVW